MPRRGRKPVPLEQLKMRGTAVAHKVRRAESAPNPERELRVSDCPKEFSAERKAIWKRQLVECPKGMIRYVDRETYIAWVIAVDAHWKAAMTVQEEGLTQTSAHGHLIKHPAAQLMRDNAMALLRLSGDLGFTPSSRLRLGSTAPKDDNPNKGAGDDEFSALMDEKPEGEGLPN